MECCEHRNVSFVQAELVAYRCDYDPDCETIEVDYEKSEQVDILDSYLVCDDCGMRLHFSREIR